MQVNLGVPDGLLENGSPSSPEFAELEKNTLKQYPDAPPVSFTFCAGRPSEYPICKLRERLGKSKTFLRATLQRAKKVVY
jgi:hypothetical protein